MGFRRPDLEIPGTAKVFSFPAHRMVKEPWLSKQQMASELGVSQKWLERRHSQGLPRAYSANGRARYRASEVREWISAQGSDEGDAA